MITDFDPIAAAAECMEWPIIAEAVHNYHNDGGMADSVFKLIHDDYRLAQAVEICDVLLKRGKYATTEVPEWWTIPPTSQELEAQYAAEDEAAIPVQPLARLELLEIAFAELTKLLQGRYCPDTVIIGDAVNGLYLVRNIVSKVEVQS